jgi:hypothetical protein
MNFSRDGRKLYFRCSRCDTLIKKDNNRIRAKLIVQDGHIVSERYPEHHPDCTPKTNEDVFMQQIDRSSRKDVKEGYLLPQDAYKKAVSRVLEESAHEPDVVGAVEKFPDWPRLRQQYCRIRKTAVSKQYRDQGYEFSPPSQQQRYSRRQTKPTQKYSPSYDPHHMDYINDNPNDSMAYSVMKAEAMKGEDMEEDEEVVVDDDVGAGQRLLKAPSNTTHPYLAQEGGTIMVDGPSRLSHS